MPMNADVLGELMMANIDALSDESKKDRAQVFKALAAATITHIQTAAAIAGIVVTVVTPAPGAGTGIAPPGSIT